MKAQVKECTEMSLIDDVIDAVCAKLDVTREGIVSENRSRKLTEARYIIMNTLVRHHRMTYKAVGDILNRDHATVIVGVKKYHDLITIRDKAFLHKINMVIKELEGIC